MQPELQVYLTDFGKKKDDIGLAAEVDRKVIGAVWVRIMDDYGHINDITPYSIRVKARFDDSQKNFLIVQSEQTNHRTK